MQNKLFLLLSLCCTLLLLACLACAPSTPVSAPTAEPVASLTPAQTPAPTATPVPADYDANVDFANQPALLAAVQYALSTTAPEISYRMLDTIETLILPDAAGITDVSVLKRASRLQTLVIVDGTMDLSPLASLTQLTTLTVTGGHFGDLERVTALPQLTELNLFGYDTIDFSPLYNMPNLTTLRLGNHAPCDLSQLGELTQLTTLLFPDRRGNDLSWLASLENLTDLTIWQCKQRYFDFLPKLTKLQSLTLDQRTDCDLTPIGSLSNLTQLTIDLESGRTMDDQSWLSGLTQLESLTLRGLYFGNLARLAGLDSLTSLTLDGIHDSVRLHELPALPELAELNIYRNTVVDASELYRYPKLKSLVLYDSPVNDPLAVFSLTGLTSLTMRPNPNDGDRSLGDLARIADMTKLEYLDWGGRVKKLDVLLTLPALTSLRLANARIVDWTALTKLTNLRALDLSGNRIKRVPPSVADMQNLRTLDLSNCKNLHYIEALSTAPSLKSLALDAGRIRNANTLAALDGMTALTFVSGGRTDPLTKRHTGELVDDPALIDALRLSSPYINGAEAESVLTRFYLKDYMHQPYFCSAVWYPAYSLMQ